MQTVVKFAVIGIFGLASFVINMIVNETFFHNPIQVDVGCAAFGALVATGYLTWACWND